MGASQSHKRRYRYGFQPEFWNKLGLAVGLAALFSGWLSLAVGLIVLTLPARWFRPRPTGQFEQADGRKVTYGALYVVRFCAVL